MLNEITKRILSTLFLIPIAFFFIIKGSFFFNFFIFICFLVTVYEWYQMSKKKNYLIPGIILIFLSFYTVYLLRFDDLNLFSFLLIIFTCIGTDMGGFIFGKIFKGPKLTKISPNKTYSGMFGGIFLSIILVNILINNIYLLNISYVNFTQETFVIVILISLVSQTGDLIVSYFKRLSKIKNT